MHRVIAVILSQMRQLPAFWMAQQQGEWNGATRELINTGMPAVGPLDDLEVCVCIMKMAVTALRMKTYVSEKLLRRQCRLSVEIFQYDAFQDIEP